MGCHITGVFDVNRQHTLPNDDFGLVQAWADSIASMGLTAVLLHNGFSPKTIRKHQSKHLLFRRVQHAAAFSPNVYRYGLYEQLLRSWPTPVEAVFFTDVSDVVVLNNPFVQPLFLSNPQSVFCGDEPKPLQNDWMLDHGTFFRQAVPDYARFEADFAHLPLLNCGIIGGSAAVMLPFVEALWALHARFNGHNNTAFTGDMGMFNYLVRTRYNGHVLHGSPVNTVFKGYETQRSDCWFRHK
ncbi:MAG: hypothetical protein EAY75_10475 [Bacteroidetes bacterium]|nr:MAG: hypothetical protein EAY75_10475 [Bacteroidota bacterium]